MSYGLETIVLPEKRKERDALLLRLRSEGFTHSAGVWKRKGQYVCNVYYHITDGKPDVDLSVLTPAQD